MLRGPWRPTPLTGDKGRTASAVAAVVGNDEVIAGVLTLCGIGAYLPVRVLAGYFRARILTRFAVYCPASALVASPASACISRALAGVRRHLPRHGLERDRHPGPCNRAPQAAAALASAGIDGTGRSDLVGSGPTASRDLAGRNRPPSRDAFDPLMRAAGHRLEEGRAPHITLRR